MTSAMIAPRPCQGQGQSLPPIVYINQCWSAVSNTMFTLSGVV